MAVMTYKELKERGLDHGKKWFGYSYIFLVFNMIDIFKINFDLKDKSGSYLIKDGYMLFEDEHGELKVSREKNIKKHKIQMKGDIPDHIIFGDSMQELLEYARNTPILCPAKDDGPVFGFKLLSTDVYKEYALCILEIPSDARRTNAYFGRKCRADKVKVKKIWKLDKNGSFTDRPEELKKGYSVYKDHGCLEYIVGETLYSEYNDCRLRECTDGIHFFTTVREVIEMQQQLLGNK